MTWFRPVLSNVQVSGNLVAVSSLVAVSLLASARSQYESCKQVTQQTSHQHLHHIQRHRPHVQALWLEAI